MARCCKCRYYFHLKFAKLNKNDVQLPPDWICTGCTMKTLPFSSINDENIKLTNHGLSEENIDFVTEKCPSFSIKTLLDQMPGQKIDTDQFMSNTIHLNITLLVIFCLLNFQTKKFLYFISIFHRYTSTSMSFDYC